MRSDAALADRRETVRESAREWLRAHWIDIETFRKIEEMYPDDRVRTSPAFRILFFGLTLAAIGGLLGALYSQIDHAGTAALFALAAGGVCWVITNHLTGAARRRGGGIEAAFSVAAIGNLMICSTAALAEYHLMHERWAVIMILLLLALLSAAAAWLWGYWPYMIASAASLFCAAMSLPAGRILWILGLGVAYRFLVLGWDSGGLPPSQRKCCAAFLTVALLGAYAAVNVFLLDQHSLRWFQGRDFFPRWLSICFTAALPCLLFWIGILRKRQVFLLLGFGLSLFSLLTLRMYVHVAPAWLLLASAGILLIICAALLRRFLESGAGSERAGFTAAPLTGQPEKHRAIEIVASISTLTPESNEAPEKSGFRGGGGTFGGGGASGKF